MPASSSPPSPSATPKPSSAATAPSPVPPPVPVETHPNRGAFKPPLHRQISDPNRLAPEDAYKTFSPPRLRPLTEISGINGSAAASAAAAALRPAVASLRAPPAIPPVALRLEQEKKRRNASRKRHQPPQAWKKLLWIKQHGFPDNYTDTDQFLDHLKRPDLRPYEFWPLMANATVIVQHMCSVSVFSCAYAGIYQDRLSPVAVVTCGSIATIIGWLVWDWWMGEEEAEEVSAIKAAKRMSGETADDGSSTSSGGPAVPPHANGHTAKKPLGRGLGLTLSTTNLNAKNDEEKSKSKHGPSLSKSSYQSISPIDPLNESSPLDPFPKLRPAPSQQANFLLPHPILPASVPRRDQARRKTFKSTLLIVFALLALSPTLKSLTKSWSSDSIWAMAVCLMIVNIFFFDYSSLYAPSKPIAAVLESASSNIAPVDPFLAPVNTSVRASRLPSPLSTNAAVMASTVMASRLNTTEAVFSLMLFSIEIFGLFPIFRRHLRHESWNGHILLSLALIAMSSCGLGLILSQSYTHTYGDCHYCWGWLWHAFSRSTIGLFIGGLSTAFVMGGCSWWLIGLQRYKNVVQGPWDPAKPVLAGGAGRSRGGTD